MLHSHEQQGWVEILMVYSKRVSMRNNLSQSVRAFHRIRANKNYEIIIFRSFYIRMDLDICLEK